MQSDTEKIIDKIAALGRAELVELLRGMHCDFKIDFTDEFLNSISVERLRHITLAAALHAHGVSSPGV